MLVALPFMCHQTLALAHCSRGTTGGIYGGQHA